MQPPNPTPIGTILTAETIAEYMNLPAAYVAAKLEEGRRNADQIDQARVLDLGASRQC